MIEEWRDIKGYEGKYQISNMGNVVSLKYHRGKRSKLLKPRYPKPPHNEYGYVVLSKDNKVRHFYLHRLVAEHFVSNPDNKAYVNHKDGDKHNNTAANLEWVTPLKNNLHSYHILGKHPMRGFRFDKNINSKKVEQYYVSPEGYEYHIATYANASAASLLNNVNERSINLCCNGKYKQAGGYKWRFEE